MDEQKKMVYSQERLEKLKLAREKANAIRTEKAEEKKKIKLAEQIDHYNKVEEAEKKIKGLSLQESKQVPEHEESEEEAVVIKKKAPPKKKKIIVVESSDDEGSSSSEEEIVYVKPKKKVPASRPIPITKPSPPPFKQAPLTPQQVQYFKLYKSLFG